MCFKLISISLNFQMILNLFCQMSNIFPLPYGASAAIEMEKSVLLRNCTSPRHPRISSLVLCNWTDKEKDKMGKSKEGVEKHLQGGFRFTVEANDISKWRLFPFAMRFNATSSESRGFMMFILAQISKFVGNMNATKMSFFKWIIANILSCFKKGKKNPTVLVLKSLSLIQVQRNDGFNSWWFWLQTSPDVRSRQTYWLCILVFQIQDKCHLNFFNRFL